MAHGHVAHEAPFGPADAGRARMVTEPIQRVAELRLVARVDADRHFEFGGNLPERVVVRMAVRTPGPGVGEHHCSLAAVGNRAGELGCREISVAEADVRDGDQPSVGATAEVGDPPVVRARVRVGEPGVADG